MKKVLLFMLSFVLLFSAACADGETSDGSEEAMVAAVNRFETQSDLDTMTLHGVLGRAELNQDPSFVKEGEGSLKTTVISDPYKSAQPYLYQSLKIEKSGSDYTDFSKTEHVTLSVYSAQAAVCRIGLQMVFASGNGTGVTEWFDLVPSGWTFVKYTIVREFIPEIVGLEGKTMCPVTGLNIFFERPKEDEVFYLDDLKIYKTEKTYVPIEMSLAADEICSFDKLWQVQKLGFECYGGEELFPHVSFVNDNTSTGKGAALKIETVPGTGQERWPGIVLNEEMLAMVDWASYGEEDRLCFDVYTPAKNGLDKVYLNLYSNGTNIAAMDGFSLQRGEWVTVSYTVKELNARSPSPSLDFSKVTGIKLFYLEHTGEAKIVYVDNFRMERAE